MRSSVVWCMYGVHYPTETHVAWLGGLVLAWCVLEQCITRAWLAWATAWLGASSEARSGQLLCYSFFFLLLFPRGTCWRKPNNIDASTPVDVLGAGLVEDLQTQSRERINLRRKMIDNVLLRMLASCSSHFVSGVADVRGASGCLGGCLSS